VCDEKTADLVRKLKQIHASGVRSDEVIDEERALALEIGKHIKDDPSVRRAFEHDPAVAGLISPFDVDRHPVLR